MRSRVIKKIPPKTDESFVFGFGEYRETAIKLLSEVANLLNDLKNNWFLISGTLLGKIRHKDFIPWDDDIDLMVEANIFEKVLDLKVKYPHLNFICADYMTYVKVSFKNEGYQIPSPNDLKKDHLEDKLVENRWPFIDLYTYTVYDKLLSPVFVNPKIQNSLRFFHKDWDSKEFFPTRKTKFLGMDVFIPRNPDYFLSINYGNNYMTEFLNDGFCHKIDKKRCM